jgi:hypothetical protein
MRAWRKTLLFVVPVIPMLFLGARVVRTQGPTLKTVTITFQTTSNDKDWDTQVQDRIVCDGVDAAKLFCCSADRREDHWDNNSSKTRSMDVLQRPDKAKLLDCALVLGSQANRNDEWVFVPTLHIEYSDGSREDRTYPQTTLDSRGHNAVTKEYRIRDSH